MTPDIIDYKIKTAVFNHVFAHLQNANESFIPKLSEKTDIAAYSKKIVENSFTFEAWINGELAGLIAAYFNDTKNYSGYITNVSTLKKYAGKGIASQLMKMCIDYAAEHKFSEISLEVFNKNNSAIQLYKKNDFYQTGSNGDLIIMKRDL
jgi:ribosomal protein S18 acetylase RimI-like enzyme